MTTSVLTAEDLGRLEQDLFKHRLPETEGFFFGSSADVPIEDDLAFIVKARKAITEGYTVYYTSWW